MEESMANHRVRWPHGPETPGARRVSGQQQEGGTGRGGGRCSRWKAERERPARCRPRVQPIGRSKVIQSKKRSLQLVALTPLARSEEHTSELQSLMRISYA